MASTKRQKYSMLIFFVALAVLHGCADPSFNGKLSKPIEAQVNVSATLSDFDADTSDVLFRYLAGNPRWEIREERGKRYAIRRELVDGKLETTLNGFYSTYGDDSEVRQTRVLISFGQQYGFGVEHGNVTRTTPGAPNVPVVVESEHAGTPGNSSYLIVQGSAANIEIFDQSPTLERGFTKAALKEIDDELKAVLTHREAIDRTGLLPVEGFYPHAHATEASFTVSDGMQPGIYLLRAHLNPRSKGRIEARVFNAETGQQLSKERLVPESRRFIGWSENGDTYFEYNSEVTVYEGDWDSQYKARFELWHVTDEGETRMVEHTRSINGWQG